MNKKIGVIFDGLGYGGIERVGIDYLKILKSLGYHIDVFNTNPKHNDMLKELDEDCGYYEIKLPLLLCPDRYALLCKKSRLGIFIFPLAYIVSYILLALFKMWRRLFFRKKYDVVISFAGHYRDLTANAYNIVKSKKKVAWAHGFISEYLLMNFANAYMYNKIHNIVSLSSIGDNSLRSANKFLNISLEKIYNPSFILQKEIIRDDEKIGEYGDFILNVARFEMQKDHFTIIKAVKILKEKGIVNKFVFVGDGTLLNKVRDYARELGVHNQCIFVGATNNVAQYYEKCKIFVHSSPAEGLPTVIIEAMLFDKPIVATNSPEGVPELLENGKYGLTVPVGDYDGMAQEICSLLEDKEKYNFFSMQSATRKHSFTPETIEHRIDEYLKKI